MIKHSWGFYITIHMSEFPFSTAIIRAKARMQNLHMWRRGVSWLSIALMTEKVSRRLRRLLGENKLWLLHIPGVSVSPSAQK